MTTEAETIADLAHATARKPHTLIVKDGPLEGEVLLTPHAGGSGWEIKTSKALLADHRSAPDRRRGTANFTDLESFIAHVKRFKDDDSLVFLDRSGVHANGAPTAKLLAVLDYHRKGADGAPRFGQHRSVYSFPFSDAWGAWTARSGTQMGQDVFAQWIEDRILDVIDPGSAGESAKKVVEILGCALASSSKLLELSRGLELHVGQKVKQAVRLSSGEMTISFDEEHTDKQGAPLKVPGAFLLGIPVFRNGDPYQVAARLRYRVVSGQVQWSYELHRVHDVLDHALSEAVHEVAEATTLDVLEGTPET